MKYAVIWKYTDAEGEVKVLTGHPGAFSDDHADALNEGRKTLEALAGLDVQPLCVVETDTDLDDDIYGCEEVYLGPEEDELFYDVSAFSKWARKDWWPL